MYNGVAPEQQALQSSEAMSPTKDMAASLNAAGAGDATSPSSVSTKAPDDLNGGEEELEEEELEEEKMAKLIGYLDVIDSNQCPLPANTPLMAAARISRKQLHEFDTVKAATALLLFPNTQTLVRLSILRALLRLHDIPVHKSRLEEKWVWERVMKAATRDEDQDVVCGGRTEVPEFQRAALAAVMTLYRKKGRAHLEMSDVVFTKAVAVTKRFLDDRDVQFQACCLAEAALSAQKDHVDDLCGMVARAMKRWLEDKDLVLQGCKALLALVSCQSEEVSVWNAAVWSAFLPLANALDCYSKDKELQLLGWEIVWQGAFKAGPTFTGVKKAWPGDQLFQALLNVMEEMKGDADVMRLCCHALYRVSLHRDSSRKVDKALVSRRLAGVMNAHGGNALVMLEACNAAETLSAAVYNVDSPLGANGICEIVVSAMGRFPANGGILKACCNAVVNMVSGEAGSEIAPRFIQAGLCPALSTILKTTKQASNKAKFSEQMPLVMQFACEAVICLSKHGKEYDRALREADVCVAIASVMREFSLDPDVQLAAAAAVGSLTTRGVSSNKSRLAFKEAGVPRLLVTALKKHAGAEDVEEECCKAIAHLCEAGGQADKEVKGIGEELGEDAQGIVQELLSAGVVERVKELTHQAATKKAACKVMQMLSLSTLGKKRLLSENKGGNVLKLLKKVKVEFKDDKEEYIRLVAANTLHRLERGQRAGGGRTAHRK